ncbi:hypothetical protein HPP92_010788 [Vanilla planifolia]|uniref:LOB domain-containing protein n=1 Tax=Vanilla planifolia TaxID=51239 RepID=A0A835QUI5_VANPL|nr:hypothetical protein HPP92_010788 [Vanilla planifolia]
MSSINGGRRCAACKYLRRRCSENCILAPHFHPSDPQRFACVHRIFGASNIARMLKHLPTNERAQAADAMAWEAYWRVQDPVYGSCAIIAHLHKEMRTTQNELVMVRAQIAIQQGIQHQNGQSSQRRTTHNLEPLNDAGFLFPDMPQLPSGFF